MRELKIHAFNWDYVESQCWCYFVLEVCRIPARWHGYILSGVIFLILGIICLILTQQVLSVLLIIFGAIALLLGILLIAAECICCGITVAMGPPVIFRNNPHNYRAGLNLLPVSLLSTLRNLSYRRGIPPCRGSDGNLWCNLVCRNKNESSHYSSWDYPHCYRYLYATISRECCGTGT